MRETKPKKLEVALRYSSRKTEDDNMSDQRLNVFMD